MVTDKGGKSAGVVVASKWQFPLGRCVLPDVVTTPPPERFCSSIWHGVIPKGILVCSIYNISGKGTSQENIDLLDSVGGYLRAFGRPFIIAGD